MGTSILLALLAFAPAPGVRVQPGVPRTFVRVTSRPGGATPAVAMSDGEKRPGILGGLSKWLGKKTADPAKAALTKRQQEVDGAVDTMFKGTGMFGALMAPLVKGMAGAVAESFAQQGADIDVVLAAVDNVLQRDSRVTAALGGGVGAGTPVGQSYSSMNINGVTRKSVALLVPVSGARAQGQARVQATIDGQGVVSNLQVVFSGPGVRELEITGGGGGGGSSSRGSAYAVGNDSDIIDV